MAMQMDLLIYVSVSLIGVYLSHVSSEYCYRGFRKQVNYRYVIYFALVLMFGCQHYSIFFNDQLINDWFYFISFDTEKPTSIMKLFSFLFFILTILTPPPSRLRLLYYVLFKRRNKSKYR